MNTYLSVVTRFFHIKPSNRMKNKMLRLLMPLTILAVVTVCCIRTSQARLVNTQYCATMYAGPHGYVKVKFIHTSAGQNYIVSATDMQDNPLMYVSGTLPSVDPMVTSVFWGSISYTENGVSKTGEGSLYTFPCTH